MKNGTVIESTGSWYKVESDGERFDCRARGKLRLKGVRSTNPVVVGDKVEFELSEDGEGIITAIRPRTNYIIRKASNLSKESHIIAANVDCALVVVSLAAPETSAEFIDRFLVTAEAYHVPAVILLNKVDLLKDFPEITDAFLDTYRAAGYRVICASVKTGEGMDEVRELVAGRTTLLSGNSGVGKSTLVKALVPDAEVKIGNISEAHLSGRHTTTFSHVYSLAGGGQLIDTPGIKGFGLIDISPDELWHYFPEMLRIGKGCKFYNCTHTHEPDCAVTAAVADGAISMSRYESYLKILDEDGKYR